VLLTLGLLVKCLSDKTVTSASLDHAHKLLEEHNYSIVEINPHTSRWLRLRVSTNIQVSTHHTTPEEVAVEECFRV
jgi:hypothetical protein